MYKRRWVFFVLGGLAFICVFFSCYDENNTFGDRLVDSVFTSVMTDTGTVIVTLMKMDSVETSGQSTIMAGIYDHPVWGKIEASSYLPFSAPSYSTERENTVLFDSLTLQLIVNTHFIGDTLNEFRIHVHELTEKIKEDENGYLYNTSEFAYEPVPMISKSFYPKPYTDDQKIELRLDDDLGEELLHLLHRRDDAISAERFQDYFQGLVLKPDESNNSMLTFQANDSSGVIVLHYHLTTDPEDAKTVKITLNTAKQFNNFNHDYAGTPLESIEMENVEISSAEVGNRGVLYGGLGWYCRLDFPHINNLMWTGERVEVDAAYLMFYPELGTYSDFNALPDSVYLYIADENNVTVDVVNDYLGSEVQIATLVEKRDVPNGTYYYFDITDFIQQEMGTSGRYKHNLQLVFNSSTYTTTFKNLTFGDQNVADTPLKLQITYKIYEKY